MNTRGLMELIVLNVGLDLRILSPTLFAMLVLMAVITTLTTTPVLQALTLTSAFRLARPLGGYAWSVPFAAALCVVLCMREAWSWHAELKRRRRAGVESAPR